MGAAVDRFAVVDCIGITTLGSTVTVFLMWGLSTSLAPLYLFCLLYGAFAGSNSSSWSAIMRDTKEKRRGADTGKQAQNMQEPHKLQNGLIMRVYALSIV